MSKERLKKRLRKLIAMALVFVLSAAMLPAGSLKDGVKAATTTFTAMTLTYKGELAVINLNEGSSVPLEGVSAYSIAAVSGVTLKNVSWGYAISNNNTSLGAYSYDTNHPTFLAGKSRIRVTLTVGSSIAAADTLKVKFLDSTLPFVKSSASTSTTLYYDYWFDVGAPLTTLTDISSATVTFPTVTYTGSSLYPEPTVKVGSTTLVKDVDYTLWSYTNNVNAGTGQVSITGTGNYKNTIQKDFTISPKSISTATVSAIPDQTFTGDAIEPVVTVKDGTKTLTLNTDYTVSYSNNTNVGTASVKIMGKGNYTGNTPIKTFNIVSTSESAVSDAVTINYTDGTINIKEGQLVPIAPEKYSIEAGTVYNFSSLGWWNVSADSYYGSGDRFVKGGLKLYLNLEASKSFAFPESITVTFNGDISSWSRSGSTSTPGKGQYVKDVNVPAADAADKINISTLKDYCDLIDEGEYDYAGVELNIGVQQLKDGSKVLSQGTDYTVDIPEKVKPGTYALTVNGIGDYTGSFTVNYIISPLSIKSATIIAIPDQTYTGSPLTPEIEVYYNDTKLTEGTDYEVSYTDNTAVGTAKVRIDGNGIYGKYKETTFNIVSNGSAKTNISGATVAAIADQTYTGSAITPTVIVTYGGTTLLKGTDYNVAFQNNTNVGTANVTITGTGNYTGTRTATFKIVAPALPAEFKTAKKVDDGSALDYNSNSNTYYRVQVVSTSYLQFTTPKGSYYDDAVEITVYDGEGNEVYKIVQAKRESASTNQYKYDTLNLPVGVYYISVTGSGTNSVSLTVNEVEENGSSSGTEVIEMPIVNDKINLSWKQTASGGTKNRVYYKLVVPEKTYYHFSCAGLVTPRLYKGDYEAGEEAVDALLIFDKNTEHLLDKGTYLLVMYGATNGEQYSVYITSREFNDIKAIDVKDYYEVYVNSLTTIQLAYTPSDYDSTIKWSTADKQIFEITNYDYDMKEFVDNNKAFIYAKTLGKYTATITTSEGVSKTVTVMVKPHPTKVSAAEATTTSKKNASITIEWSGDGNYYKIYEKSGNSYKLVKETTASKITLTKAPGKTYNYRVESCYKSGNEIICSSTGDGVNVITAPYKMPTIKTAKQTGKTKYTKPGTKKIKRWNSKWEYWYWDTVKTGNISTATIKLKIKKVSGAKTYEFNKGKGNRSGSPASGKIYFTYSGKIKSRTESVKIRGVWKSGITTAYGPWTKTKKIKIKGNK